MKVKVLKVEQPEGRSERATVEMRNGIVLQVRSSECADLGTPQAELALSEHSNKPSTQHEKKVGEAFATRYHGVYDFHSCPCFFFLTPNVALQFPMQPLHAHNQEGVAKEEAPWLMPHIRVKMISKSKEGGALYLKKCEIVDVTASRRCALHRLFRTCPVSNILPHASLISSCLTRPCRCSVVLDSGRIIGDVTQRQLETSLPKPGGRVIVVLGENRGERGKLIERNSETGTVQLNNDFSLHKLPLDCIAEYCGAHDDED
jgi:G patch domain/KOW motif-containing protein